MAPFLWFVLQVDEGMTTTGAFSWYLKLGFKKLVFLGLAFD
jgi:hypothetical protein